MRAKLLLSAVALSVVVASARADDGVFRLTTNVAGVRTQASFASVEAAFDALKNTNLQAINAAYSGIQPVRVDID